MKLIQSGLTDVGQKRKVNQDSILLCMSEDGNTCLGLVADGMGGHSDGEVASGIIRDYLKVWWDNFDAARYNNNFADMMSSIQDTVYQANEKIYMDYNNGQMCGSTCILLFIHAGQYGVVNAGDSHIYMRRGFSIKSVMIDDVWENQRAVKELLTEKQIQSHSNYGKLVNAVGTDEKITLTSKTGPLKKNDTFIICSDGLYKYCPFKYIKRALWYVNEKNIDDYVQLLKSETYKAGAKDNISIIIVKYVKA